MISKFSDSSSNSSVTANFDCSHDKAITGEGNRRAEGVGAFTMDGEAFLGQQAVNRQRTCSANLVVVLVRWRKRWT